MTILKSKSHISTLKGLAHQIACDIYVVGENSIEFFSFHDAIAVRNEAKKNGIKATVKLKPKF